MLRELIFKQPFTPARVHHSHYTFHNTGHLHDVIWLRLPECILLQSLLCYVDFCHAWAILHKRKNTEYSSLPQSIVVVVRSNDVIMQMSYWYEIKTRSLHLINVFLSYSSFNFCFHIFHIVTSWRLVCISSNVSMQCGLNTLYYVK